MSESETDFSKQLEADQSRTLRVISPESPAAHILSSLYPLLNGPLYPSKKGSEIARLLDHCIQTGLQVNLFAVVTTETAKTELPYLVNAVEIFRNKEINTLVTTALVVNWPPRMVKLDALPAMMPLDLTVPVTALIRKSQQFDYVEQLSLDNNEIDQKDPLRTWLVNFYLRQRSMADIRRAIGFQVDPDLAMRRKIGKRISTSPTSGLNLGLTTEHNPQLLRCYGKDTFLANIDVRDHRSNTT